MCTQPLHLQDRDNARCELLSVDLNIKKTQGVDHTFEITFESTIVMEYQSFLKKKQHWLKKIFVMLNLHINELVNYNLNHNACV